MCFFLDRLAIIIFLVVNMRSIKDIVKHLFIEIEMQRGCSTLFHGSATAFGDDHRAVGELFSRALEVERYAARVNSAHRRQLNARARSMPEERSECRSSASLSI
ncbi:MAG TPA: hypothetical protein VFL80_09545, partial [Thermoanaerobaculia bacterium]|nr:hypothetical protein [Thermoanaerobaculia bacterium]